MNQEKEKEVKENKMKSKPMDDMKEFVEEIKEEIHMLKKHKQEQSSPITALEWRLSETALSQQPVEKPLENVINASWMM